MKRSIRCSDSQEAGKDGKDASVGRSTTSGAERMLRGGVRSVGMLLLLFLPERALAQAPTLYVENATGAEDLISILREELPGEAFARTATSADLRARLTESLRLSIVDRAGITLVDRALEGEREAAVRVAALLIVEARESWSPAPVRSPPPIEAIAAEAVVTSTPASSWYAGGSAGVGLGMWASRAQLAFGAAAYVGISDFEVGASFSIAGRGCACAVRTESLRVEPSSIALLAEGRWIFWRPLEAFETSVWLAAGYQWETVASRVIGTFAANGPLESVATSGPIARGGISAGSLLFELVRIRIDFGVQVQRPASVTLPPFEEYREAPGGEVRRGVVMPWGVLSLGVAI